jgi:hypothetical protein
MTVEAESLVVDVGDLVAGPFTVIVPLSTQLPGIPYEYVIRNLTEYRPDLA